MVRYLFQAQDETVPLDYFPVSTQITAYHLLGDTVQASALAKTFLNQYPEFKPATSDVVSNFYSTDWNRNYEQFSERIQNRYHIAVAYEDE